MSPDENEQIRRRVPGTKGRRWHRAGSTGPGGSEKRPDKYYDP